VGSESAEVAFERLYMAHRDAVLRYVLRRLPREDALDVAAETFSIAWQRRGQLPADPLPWLYRVAFLQSMNRSRQSQRNRALLGRLQSRRLVTAMGSDEDGSVEVIRLLGFLRPIDREVISLVAVEGLSIADAAAVLGCSTATATVRIHRARKRFSALLAIEHAAVLAPAKNETPPGAEALQCQPSQADEYQGDR
jgi:RNA polymerase sigma-70 factor (ECF subfamily)